MADNVVDVEALIDRQKLRPVNLWFLAVLLFALIADGFDLQIMGFAAPSLVADWHIQRAALGPVLSASLVGILIGAPLFGALGDRFGRKTAVIAGSLVYGLLSLACMYATSLEQLAALRFLTGVGIGGVMPNVMALAAELSPKRSRALMASLVVIGLNIGAAMPGVVRPWIPAEHEWRGLFLIGGVAPLAIAAVMALTLPESLMFLTHRGLRRDQLATRALKLDPSLAIDAATRFVLGAEQAAKGGVRALFAGRYAVITPILWYVFAASLFTIFIRSSWTPLLLADEGVSRERVAVFTLLMEVTGSVAGVVSGLVLGRLGLIWPAVLLLVGAAAMACLSRVGLDGFALEAVAIALGVGLSGTQAALNVSAALIYPTPCRPTGVGSALGAGRLGAILGPMIGAAVVALGATPRDMFLAPAIPLVVAAAALLWVRRLQDVRNSA